jgi:broad specificity phosphatase PhoE
MFPLDRSTMTKIYIVRHASPDWSMTNIPYDIQPGPPLSPKGEKEAEALGEFLKPQGVVKLYYSPFARSARTAQIILARSGIPCVAEIRLAEWRKGYETTDKVAERMSRVFDELTRESAVIGPVALVSHGGPIACLLLSLGIDKDTLSVFRKKFDGGNPLPPAGAWAAEWNEEAKTWDLNLLFIPATQEEVH